MRDKYGDGIVSLAAGMSAAFRARVHENPEESARPRTEKEEPKKRP